MNDFSSQLASAFAHANPGLFPAGAEGGGAAVRHETEAQAFARLGAAPSGGLTRTAAAGGIVANLFQHPSFLPVESLFRKLAEQAMFQSDPQHPFKFELGAIAVPKNQALLVVDYSFCPHRLSGAAAGDTIPLEDERMSTLFAFDFTVNSTRKATLRMEIDPVPIEATKEAFIAQTSGGTVFPTARAGAGLARAAGIEFNLSRYARSVVPAGAGLSALPNRARHAGPRGYPLMLLAQENQRVQGTCTIFRPIPIPLAFFELDVSGFLMSKNTMRDMLETVKPVSEQEMRGHR